MSPSGTVLGTKHGNQLSVLKQSYQLPSETYISNRFNFFEKSPPIKKAFRFKMHPVQSEVEIVPLLFFQEILSGRYEVLVCEPSTHKQIR